jgi:hypothetical protein
MSCWTTKVRQLFMLLQKVESMKAVRFFLRRPEFEGLINEQDKEGNMPMLRFKPIRTQTLQKLKITAKTVEIKLMLL